MKNIQCLADIPEVKTERIEWGDTVTFDLPPRFCGGLWGYRIQQDQGTVIDGEVITLLGDDE